MIIRFNHSDYEFVPWREAMGCVFNRPFAFDSETTLIDRERQWLTPAYVIGAAFDGVRGFYVPRDRVAEFFIVHGGLKIVFHNASFDLDVINMAAPAAKMYDRVAEDAVWDTQLMHRLLALGEQGHTAQGKGESSLDTCAAKYLEVELAKDIKDADGDSVRLSYGKWLNRPLNQIEPAYLEYLAADVIATQLLFKELRTRTWRLLQSAGSVWGYVSDDWLRGCIERFGPQTHHLQLKAAIVLRAITANGLHLDAARRGELAVTLTTRIQELKAGLRAYGYLAGGPGSSKSLQAVLKLRARTHPRSAYPLTETGQFATSYDALHELVDVDPFVKLLLEYRETEKLLGSFVGKMAKSSLHPSFNVLARTGRTTSFGEINAQNLPKSDEVRCCFVPRPCHEFIDADYSTIELATLAQACLRQFGLDSQMAAAINSGEDLHRLVAARMLDKPPNDVTKDERQKAKPVNFGKPGGMGPESLMAYAKVSYGVHLSPEEAAALSESWFDLFPEMLAFLNDNTDTTIELAALLDLTPESHFAATDDARFINHPKNRGQGDVPHAILGSMLLKVVKEPKPSTREGRPNSQTDCDYLWSKLDVVAYQLPAALQKAIRARQPSKKLQRAVMGLVGRAGVFTLSGRLRANASYCARHNTIFQGLAADGAKLALWHLWRAGYRIVNFIHDQVLIEIPAGTGRERMEHAMKVRELMIVGMREVVPDVCVDVSYAAAARWYRDAVAVKDATGDELLLWAPAVGNEVQRFADTA